jgi:hypothetical protein
LLFMDLCAARGFQGLRLGQGGLILGRDARIADCRVRPFNYLGSCGTLKER